MDDWRIFKGNRRPHDGIDRLPPPPPWRPYRVEAVARERLQVAVARLPPAMRQRGRTFQSNERIVEIVNAALHLRRPILVTGKPGSGKSSLVDAVAYELKLGEPMRWAVTSRSTLRDALYSYDAIARLQAGQAAKSGSEPPITKFLRLGPMGTAMLPTARPRALLVDEIDKADLDLPNDLLNILEEGEFEIPELARLEEEVIEVRLHHGKVDDTYPLTRGMVRTREFPFVIFTSNGERDFPPAFLRRCLRLDMPDPCADPKRLADIVKAHLKELFDAEGRAEIDALIAAFVTRAAKEPVATDQLLNAVFLVVGKHGVPDAEKATVVAAVTRALS